MKSSLTILATLSVLTLVGTRAVAQTINWGSPVFSDLVDSYGQPLDDSYHFELGTFVPDFIPNTENAASWAANWRTFDTAAYNGFSSDDGIDGYFTSSVRMMPGGKSSNTSVPDLGLNFEDRSAYIWIYNRTDPSPATEWLLARSSTWTFPKSVGCCDNAPPLDWSISNLTSADVPLYGKQGDTTGPGVNNENPAFPHSLETFTFVPEPSSSMLLALAGMLLTLRRRRD